MQLYSKFYSGQTGRDFYKCFREHFNDITNTNFTSDFATHIQDAQSTYTNITNYLHMLHIINKSNKLDVIEQFEVY